MTGNAEAPKLRTLEDFKAAQAEGGVGRCDRCRREAATFRIDARLRPARADRNGVAPVTAKVLSSVCEPCGVEILSVVGRAVGQIR